MHFTTWKKTHSAKKAQITLYKSCPLTMWCVIQSLCMNLILKLKERWPFRYYKLTETQYNESLVFEVALPDHLLHSFFPLLISCHQNKGFSGFFSTLNSVDDATQIGKFNVHY